MAKRQQWLELAELGLLFVSFLAIAGIFMGGAWQTPIITLWLALCLNTFNRINVQRRQRQQISRSVKHLERKIQSQLQQLSTQVQQNSNIKSSIAQLNTQEEMQDYLGSLEKSLTNVVQYLNQEALDERIKNLEQELLRQQQAIAPPELMPGKTTPLSPPEPRTSVKDPWDTVEAASAPPTPKNQPRQLWQCIQLLDAHRDCVSALSFSDDQKLLASGSWDQQLKVWQVSDGQQVTQTQAHSQGLLNLKFIDGFMDRLLGGLLDGETKPYAIASSSFESDVKLWHLDLETESIPALDLKQTFRDHQAAVYALAVTPEGRLLSGSHDQTIRQWNLKNGDLEQTAVDADDQIQAIACAPDGNIFLTGGTEGLVKFWRSDNHQPIGSLGNDQPEAIAAIAIRPDGEFFVSGGESGMLYLWQLDLNTLEALPDAVPCFTLPAHDKAITHISFSPQGNYLITGSVNGVIKIWQLGLEAPLATLHLNDPQTAGNARLLSLAISADGLMLAAGGSDGKIKLWLQQ
ncbi:MAG: WD40 repeat domain-containing protein [Limnothrix sp. RL_2_0]|nr:WD40 repeat domain-containing protein [Limnothrix sp. RL_2_0]